MRIIKEKRKVLRVTLVFFSIFLVSFGVAYSQPVHQELRGLNVKNINEVLGLPEDQIDFPTAILLISKRAYKDLYKIDINLDKYRDTIDEMAMALSKKIGKERGPEDIIKIMNHYLFVEEGFSFDLTDPRGKNPENVCLNSVMDRKQGSCMGLSILYFSIAERIGFPLYGVCAPDHFFVRYEDNLKRINIETTMKGKSEKDGYYIKKFKIPKGGQFYLKSLGKKEAIGAYLNNIGSVYGSKGQYDQAISDFNEALKINPGDAEAYVNRGNAYLRKGQYDQAISDCNKALKINPGLAEAYVNRGIIYYFSEEYDKAWEDVHKAQDFGYQVRPGFLKDLREASGRQR